MGFLSGILGGSEALTRAVASTAAGLGSGKPAAPSGGGRGGVMGFLNRLGRGLGDERTQMRMARAQALMQGDNATAARITAALGEMEGDRAEAEEAARRRESLFNNLTKDSGQGGFGMSAGEAERALTNPEAFGTNFNERYGSFNMGEGDTLRHGGPGGSGETYRAPKTFEQGADSVTLDFETGEASRVEGMTAAEQEARSIGLQPGTPMYEAYIRDRNLGAQGPTAVDLAQDRMQTDRDIAGMNERGRMERHTTPPARRSEQEPAPSPDRVIGGIMAKIQRGEQLTPQEQTLYDQYRQGRGNSRRPGRAQQGAGVAARPNEAIARFPDGTRRVVRNGQWVPVG